jgi:hypothetical protein
LASDSASRRLFKELKFVNFEFRVIPPLLSRYFLGLMTPDDIGIKLLSAEGKSLYSDLDYSTYKSAY